MIAQQTTMGYSNYFQRKTQRILSESTLSRTLYFPNRDFVTVNRESMILLKPEL